MITFGQQQARHCQSTIGTGRLHANEATYRRRVAPLLPEPCLSAPAQQRHTRPIWIGLDETVVLIKVGATVGIAQQSPLEKFLRGRVLNRCHQLRRVAKLVLLHQLDCLFQRNKIRQQLRRWCQIAVGC